MEQPICYSTCIAAELACGGNSQLATFACDKALAAGRVAPDRPDVTCLSCSSARKLTTALAVALAATLLT